MMGDGCEAVVCPKCRWFFRRALAQEHRIMCRACESKQEVRVG
jgi:hypothetical protein